MNDLGHNSEMTAPSERAIVLPEANSGLPLKGDFERMARRRFQNPKPFREGSYWWIKPWMDEFVGGKTRTETEADQIGSGYDGGARSQKDRQ